jgi:HupE / UreJ protein
MRALRVQTHRYWLLCVFWSVLCAVNNVQSDDSQPLYIQINEQQTTVQQTVEQKKKGALLPAVFQLRWRIPVTIELRNAPLISLPPHCKLITGSLSSISTEQRHLYQCARGLAGETVRVRYPFYNPPNSTLIKYLALTGEQHTRLLSPSETVWKIPLAESKSRVAKDYTQLGIQHIWAGTDHLLFLLCLLWIAGNFRSVMITITGFTVAHSITLILSALQWVRLPVIPVEAVIALSIVFLACEIVKNNKNTLTWRHPIAVSSSFGLLHGFGFAAALAEIGLPQTELITGLLFFNVGVEIGQVLFAGAALFFIVLAKRFVAPRLSQYGVADFSRLAGGYCIGGLAAFWLVERAMNIVAPIIST